MVAVCVYLGIDGSCLHIISPSEVWGHWQLRDGPDMINWYVGVQFCLLKEQINTLETNVTDTCLFRATSKVKIKRRSYLNYLSGDSENLSFDFRRMKISVGIPMNKT
jgi:hypothetical protein